MLLCPYGAILLWVRIWVKRFSANLQKFSPNFLVSKTQEKVLKSYDFRTFYGCGGRTRTYDLRVMSPTSFHLLYSAILGCTPNVLGYCSTAGWVCQDVFPAMFWQAVSVSREIVKLTTPGETRIIDIISRREAFYAYIIQSRCCAGSVAAFPP